MFLRDSEFLMADGNSSDVRFPDLFFGDKGYISFGDALDGWTKGWLRNTCDECCGPQYFLRSTNPLEAQPGSMAVWCPKDGTVYLSPDRSMIRRIYNNVPATTEFASRAWEVPLPTGLNWLHTHDARWREFITHYCRDLIIEGD